MTIESTLESKSEIAFRALKGLFASMNSAVLVQSTTAAKSFGALIAFEWSFSRVGSVVNLKMTRSVEHLETSITLVLFLSVITFFRMFTNVLL